MRCGNCKEEGVTIGHVRSCYGVEAPAGERADFKGPDNMTGVIVMNPPSDAQIKYVLGLQEERDCGEAWEARTAESLKRMERVDVSALINTLKAMPHKHREARVSGRWTMPAGRYALLVDTTVDPERDAMSEEWRFYQVDKPTEGRWAGYTFIKRLIGAPGAYKKINISDRRERDQLLARIERDPERASLDYGKESGVCGVCSSPLTDPQSLALGIGPVCRSKTGWAS